MTATITEPAAGLALSAEAQDLLFREARTANSFTDEPVSDEQMQAVYDLMKYAPTSMNTSPLRIALIRSPEATRAAGRAHVRPPGPATELRRGGQLCLNRRCPGVGFPIWGRWRRKQAPAAQLAARRPQPPGSPAG